MTENEQVTVMTLRFRAALEGELARQKEHEEYHAACAHWEREAILEEAAHIIAGTPHKLSKEWSRD